jgi:Gas vesicle synthesis protein GvpL/GvpF
LRVFGETRAPLPAVAATELLPGPGARYLSARREVLQARAAVPEIEPLRAMLHDLVRAERAVRHEAVPLLASVYHLVARGSARRYRQSVESAAAALAPFRVTVSGPWAAYAFGPGELA